MKIVVIGGTGRIGSRIVRSLSELGHQAVAASPETGVDTLTGEGLGDVMDGAQVVIDVSNSPSLDGSAAIEFFSTATSNVLAAGLGAGVRHYVALSVVGTDRLVESGYFQAKLTQETLVRQAAMPHTIVRATQFFEFVAMIADAGTDGDIVRLPPVLIQPMAADDVARAVVRAALSPPANGIVETAGPETFRLDELVRGALRTSGDARRVIADPHARYYGAAVQERTLVPDDGAWIGAVRFDAWMGETSRETAREASILRAGVAAPDFTLRAGPGREFRLAEQLGHPVVLAFYPADWSPVCGDQLALYNEVLGMIGDHGATLAGVSVDSVWCHAAYSEHRNLHFPLLADFEPKGAVSRLFGAYRDADGTCERALFVIDGAGIIRWSYLSPIDSNPGADGLLAALESIAVPATGGGSS